MSAREWTHAEVRYRMPRYGDALRLVQRAATLPRGTDLATQVEGLPFFADLIRACWCVEPAPPGSDQMPDCTDWLADQGWSLLDILTTGTTCLTEVQRRLFTVTDGAVKHRDFTPTPATPSTTS
ncbi:MAG: hypothetical protein KJT01_01060 [Gemmatimonadetes bacterium]|nr:hypothetical protein [Gemmatimonadota bacterium]